MPAKDPLRREVRLTSEQFDWLVDLLARHAPGRRYLRWFHEHVRAEGDGFILAPPDGFTSFLSALGEIAEELAGVNEIALVYQSVESTTHADEVVAQRIMACLEEVHEDIEAEADRLDLLMNIVFYRVARDEAET
jgi:hypothetical protein